MPVRFGYDESLPDNWNNSGSTYTGPGIAQNMQSFGMNGSPYSALVPQGQANPFAGTLAMNPGATDTNNFSDWESQYTQPSQPQSPVIGSPALTGGGQRPASAGGTGGYDPNWQPLLTPYNTSNPSQASDPLAWVRNLDQESYYKYILPYQQRGGNLQDIPAMQKAIQDGMAAAGGGQWANGSQVNNVAGPKNDYINNPNAYANQNRGGSSPQATSTGQPTQNGSVSNTPQFNWPGLPQVDPATNMGGGVLDMRGYGDGNRMGRIDNNMMYTPGSAGGGKPFNLNDFLINQQNGNAAPGGGSPVDARQQMIADFYRTNGVAQPGDNPSGRADYVQRINGTWGPASTNDAANQQIRQAWQQNPAWEQQFQREQQRYAPGSMEERYAAMYGGSGGAGAYPTGGMDQPWNQGGGAGGSAWGQNPGYDPALFYQQLQMPSSGGQQHNALFYNGATLPSQSYQQYQNGGQDYMNASSYDGGQSWQQGMMGNNQNALAALYQQFMGGNGGQVSGSGVAAPGSMQQRNQAFYQNPGSVFGSPTGGGTSNSSSGSGGATTTPVMASPSFGFGSATGRRTGYGNQNSYYGGSSNPNSFGGSNFGNYGGGSKPIGYGGANAFTGSTGGNPQYTSLNSSPQSGGFAAGRTGRPSGFTF